MMEVKNMRMFSSHQPVYDVHLIYLENDSICVNGRNCSVLREV